MRGRSSPRGVVAGLFVSLTVASVAWSTGAAGAAAGDADGDTDRRGVVIVFTHDGDVDGGADGTGRPPATDSHGRPCVFRAWRVNHPKFQAGRPSPEHVLYHLTCNGEYRGFRWLAPGDYVVVDPRQIATRVVRSIPIAPVDIGIRPRTSGITGIPSLFWVDGYDGQPIRRTVRELGLAVDVQVRLGDARWNFGDGVTSAGIRLGEAWPSYSSVRHAFASSSPHRRPYRVTVLLTLTAEYRVDAGGWQSLDPLTRSAAAAHDVDELQAVRRR